MTITVWVTLQCCRAYSLDRQLIIEAKAAGFAIEEEMGTRQQVGGSLEGVVYSLTDFKTQVDRQKRRSCHLESLPVLAPPIF